MPNRKMASGTTNKPFNDFEYTKYSELGPIADDDYKKVMSNAFDSITIRNRVVCGTFQKNGIWLYIAYRYGFGDYGMMLAVHYSGNLLQLSRIEGTSTVYNISKTIVQ